MSSDEQVRGGEEVELAIVERLTMPFTRIPGTGERLINPDGPKAAEIIKELVAVLTDGKRDMATGERVQWKMRAIAVLTRAGVKQ